MGMQVRASFSLYINSSHTNYFYFLKHYYRRIARNVNTQFPLIFFQPPHRAVRQAGISRSTYYKYKDAIYTPESADTGRKAVISMLLSHQIGVLSNVLNRLSALGVNVLTISQSMPIHGTANVVMTLDIAQLSGSLDNAIAALGAMRGVENAMLVSIE